MASKTNHTDSESASSNPFRQVRKDHAQETAEDYVEAINDFQTRTGNCRARDLANQFGVSHVTVHRIVMRLQREKLLETEPYGPIVLTRKGKRLAAKARHRHEIVYQFLLSLGVSPPIAAIDAEGIEHHVSQETLDRFEAAMGEPINSSSPGREPKATGH